MPEEFHLFDGLSTRAGFNRSLKHFKFITQVIGEFEGNRNLAEIISDRLAEKTIEPEQVLPTLNAILVDKYHYAYGSHNLTENFESFDTITEESGKWKALDLVIAYFHPELGVVAINPKIRSHWDGVQSLKKNELITVFAGAFKTTGSDALRAQGIDLILSMIEGGKIRTPAAFLKGKFVQKRPVKVVEAAPQRRARGRPARQAPAAVAAAAASPAVVPAAAPVAVAAQPSMAQKRMTPMYAIPVTNELFHNGNVEAWKKIIQSYTTKYSGLDVFVFYEGERIHDINTLFKWGKVKHGSAIMVSVAGDNITDVAKLQRYLKQGASHMFEAFLKAPVNTVLNLF